MKHTDQSPQQRERDELELQVAVLRREVQQLRLEQDLLNKANELLKKGLGVNLQLLSNREKTLLIDALREHYGLPELLAQVGLARSSYFYHRARAVVGDKYLQVRQSITEIFESNHRCYGYRRLQASLARQQGPISEKVVQRLMKQAHLVVPKPKKRRYASYLGEISPAPENIINRDFQASAPNEKWLTDITEFQIPAGKVYLSPIIDCFDGMVVSWTIGTSPDAELVNTMLDAAIETVAETPDRPVVHSDRGGHYRWPGWLSRMSDANLTRSMSRKACSPDNAACEGFFGRLKNELFYPRDWRFATIERFELMGSLAAFHENDEAQLEQAVEASAARSDVLAWMPVGRIGWHSTGARMLLQELEDESRVDALLKVGFAKGSHRFLQLFTENIRRYTRRMFR